MRVSIWLALGHVINHTLLLALLSSNTKTIDGHVTLLVNCMNTVCPQYRGWIVLCKYMSSMLILFEDMVLRRLVTRTRVVLNTEVG